MARGSDKKKEEKKAAAEKKGSSKKGAIPKYARFAKASLAPYPDEDGAPLWLGDKEGLQELLALSNIRAGRVPINSETDRKISHARHGLWLLLFIFEPFIRGPC